MLHVSPALNYVEEFLLCYQFYTQKDQFKQIAFITKVFLPFISQMVKFVQLLL